MKFYILPLYFLCLIPLKSYSCDFRIIQDFQNAKPQIITDYTEKDLENWQNVKRKHLYGLTQDTQNLNLDLRIEKNNEGFCLKDMILHYGAQNISVFIAHEFVEEDESFQKVLKHEYKHIQNHFETNQNLPQNFKIFENLKKSFSSAQEIEDLSQEDLKILNTLIKQENLEKDTDLDQNETDYPVMKDP